MLSVFTLIRVSSIVFLKAIYVINEWVLCRLILAFQEVGWGVQKICKYIEIIYLNFLSAAVGFSENFFTFILSTRWNFSLQYYGIQITFLTPAGVYWNKVLTTILKPYLNRFKDKFCFLYSVKMQKAVIFIGLTIYDENFNFFDRII